MSNDVLVIAIVATTIAVVIMSFLIGWVQNRIGEIDDEVNRLVRLDAEIRDRAIDVLAEAKELVNINEELNEELMELKQANSDDVK